MEKNLRAAGTPEEKIRTTMQALARRNTASDQEGLWAAHAPALNAFLAADTQWRTASAGMGGLVFVGIDYAAAKVSMDLHGISLTPEQWSDLRSIESAATALRNGAKPGELTS